MSSHQPSATDREHWVDYNRWNRRDERLAELWVKDLVAWLVTSGLANPAATVLDYGCGYFDAGHGLSSHVGRVDGFDISPEARAAAAARARQLPAATIYDDVAALPRRAYDLVVVNSVFQYLKDPADLAATLSFLRELVAPRPGAAVIIADVVPEGYSAAADALVSLRVAARHGLLPPMVRHLWKAATKPGDLGLLHIAPETLVAAASRAGFACERLPSNLTPSRQRYTCRLTPVTEF